MKRFLQFLVSSETRRVVKFLLVGGSGVVVNYGVLWALPYFFSLDYRVALVIAIETSIITNFILNDSFTFADRRAPGIRALFTRLGKFNLFSLPGGILNFVTTTVLTESTNKSYLIFNIVGILLATTWNFLANYFWTWKKRPEMGA